jgi:hypothetical protein
MSRPLYQSDESYRRTLKELGRRVEAGVPLEYYDCEEIGAKNTECTLGLCDDGIQVSQDGVYRTKDHACPHDRRFFAADGQPTSASGDASIGCFYHCHIFKGNKRSRESAGQRVRAVIATVKGDAV